MDEYYVSIIIPIYNVEKYLDRCIQSVLKQSYENLEIILVDDGSPDRSPDMCDEYSKIDQRVKVVHKENGGLSDARNAGLEVAKGDYIVFLDSDDYVDLTMVEDAVRTMEEYSYDVVVWGYYTDFVDMEEKLISSRKSSFISGNFSKTDLGDLIITNEIIGILGYAWNKMYKKDLLIENDLKFTKGLSLIEDIVFNGQALIKADKISFINKPYVHYMQRPRETLGSRFYENYFDLKTMAVSSVENMLYEWGKTENEISLITSHIKFNALKSTTKLLSNAENYNKKEKLVYLCSLLKQSNVKENLKEYSPENLKDRIIKILMLKQKANLLLTLYSEKISLLGGKYVR